MCPQNTFVWGFKLKIRSFSSFPCPASNLSNSVNALPPPILSLSSTICPQSALQLRSCAVQITVLYCMYIRHSRVLLLCVSSILISSYRSSWHYYAPLQPVGNHHIFTFHSVQHNSTQPQNSHSGLQLVINTTENNSRNSYKSVQPNATQNNSPATTQLLK